MSGPDTIFTHDGEQWTPTSAAQGPWGTSLHGGAPAALLAHVLDARESRFPLARLTLDLFRPVPLAPLTVDVRDLRVGRRLAVREAVLASEGVELVRAVAVHGDQQPVTGAPAPQPSPVPFDDSVEEQTLGQAATEGTELGPPGGDGLHHRLLVRRYGGIRGGGHGVAWLRLPLALAPGVPLTPVSHLAACADFANGISQRLVAQGASDGGRAEGRPAGFINADISLHVLRPPATTAIGMISRNEVDAAGRALVSAECWQDDGLVARIVQTALVMPRD